ncbi:MAG: cyclic nucleotide-binding domain-containing protein [Xanthomonadales bacterium]|nr:cyclic nucleotide-binding domain-containing protein [Xanthomonadales bacterium]NIN59819.1 cyclic nucleotide-binding domain-containing protein [Xanthomonadales bacterium]NIN75194.1 cyclic nucleotide-binding domain-containing protein [Xanthomonadales bacterium]NIO14171.1 cyclic nucleotide-binding domain-containing protein [Xanthomonadales bacterium]NIP12212.1 cyclic nucleotide-binding domain-containing protein [Xanthomonadales bacterium]
MEPEGIKNLLSQVDLFNDLDDGELSVLAEHFSIVRHKQGETIFSEGAQVQVFSIILDGSVNIMLPQDSGNVHRISAINLATFGPGEYFGEYSVLDMRGASASAVAGEDCELLQISAFNLFHVFNQHCNIARSFYQKLVLTLIDRLREQNRELDMFTIG